MHAIIVDMLWNITRMGMKDRGGAINAGRTIMGDKICLVTGANSGIGKSVFLALARKGLKLVMVCRDRMRGETALEATMDRSDSQNVESLLADLSLQMSVTPGFDVMPPQPGRSSKSRLDLCYSPVK
jgi:NAD(P)-dependent dehydrogenase (short-subunit alcohol dehydrogenase family)